MVKRVIKCVNVKYKFLLFFCYICSKFEYVEGDYDKDDEEGEMV